MDPPPFTLLSNKGQSEIIQKFIFLTFQWLCLILYLYKQFLRLGQNRPLSYPLLYFSYFISELHSWNFSISFSVYWIFCGLWSSWDCSNFYSLCSKWSGKTSEWFNISTTKLRCSAVIIVLKNICTFTFYIFQNLSSVFEKTRMNLLLQPLSYGKLKVDFVLTKRCGSQTLEKYRFRCTV